MVKFVFQKLFFLYFKALNFIKKPGAIDVTDALQSPAHIMICLPTNPGASAYFQVHLNIFQELFPGALFTIVAAKSLPIATLPSAYRLVQYGPEDITLFGMPSTRLKREIYSTTIDLAIDLNLDFDFLSLFLCKQSRANLLIGFGHPYREYFYNFVLRLNQSQNWESAFQTLLTYLNAQGKSIAIPQTV